MQILELEIVEDRGQRLAFHLEGWFEGRIEVPRSTAPGDHRILFDWLEEPSANEVAVFVGFEI